MRKLTAIGIGLAVGTFGVTALAEDAPAAASASSSADSGIPISIGLRAGYALAFGNQAKDAPMSDFVKGAIPFTLDALFRVTRAFRVGLYGSYALMSLADKAKGGADVSGSWLKYGLELQYHLSPEASMNPWIGYGIGLESAKINSTLFSASTNGLEFAHLMAGLDFKATSAISVGPFVDFSIGQYSSVSAQIGGTDVASQDIKDKAMHMWLYFGLRGNYDLLARRTPDGTDPYHSLNRRLEATSLGAVFRLEPTNLVRADPRVNTSPRLTPEREQGEFVHAKAHFGRYWIGCRDVWCRGVCGRCSQGRCCRGPSRGGQGVRQRGSPQLRRRDESHARLRLQQATRR